jgi:hypothetical protein
MRFAIHVVIFLVATFIHHVHILTIHNRPHLCLIVSLSQQHFASSLQLIHIPTTLVFLLLCCSVSFSVDHHLCSHPHGPWSRRMPRSDEDSVEYGEVRSYHHLPGRYRKMDRQTDRLGIDLHIDRQIDVV